MCKELFPEDAEALFSANTNQGQYPEDAENFSPENMNLRLCPEDAKALFSLQKQDFERKFLRYMFGPAVYLSENDENPWSHID